MLDIQLHIFKTVVECNSFSRAARELHLTQSSVSQQIRKLEDHYGVKLFDRLYRRIVITEAGKTLYPFARRLETLYQEIDGGMQRLTGDVSGAVHIGASLTVGEYLLPRFLIDFKGQYPKVDMTMEVQNSEQITLLVADAAIDLGFIEGPVALPEVLGRMPCGGDELAVVTRPGQDFGAEPLPLARLLTEPWIMREKTSGTRQVFEQFLEKHQLPRQNLAVTMELASTQAVKQAVKSGLGMTAISSLAVAEELEAGALVRIPLLEGAISREFSLIYHRDRFWTLAADEFRQYIEAALAYRENPQDAAAENAEQKRADQADEHGTGTGP
ncbi:MAG TPA: LysR family transcriptional regulator [Selenomonadales bacterium]|nr:LysR family transcriptional regulator [Selenomonadales bacterium]